MKIFFKSKKKFDQELRQWCFERISEFEAGTEQIEKSQAKRIQEAKDLFKFIKAGE